MGRKRPLSLDGDEGLNIEDVPNIIRTNTFNGNTVTQYRFDQVKKSKQGSVPKLIFPKGMYLFNQDEGDQVPTDQGYQTLPSFGWGGKDKSESAVRKWNLTVNCKELKKPYEDEYSAGHSQILYQIPEFPKKYLLNITTKKRKNLPTATTAVQPAQPPPTYFYQVGHASEQIFVPLDTTQLPLPLPQQLLQSQSQPQTQPQLLLQQLQQLQPQPQLPPQPQPQPQLLQPQPQLVQLQPQPQPQQQLVYSELTLHQQSIQQQNKLLSTNLLKNDNTALIVEQLQSGCDVNAALAANKSTALHQAAYHGKDEQMVSVLLAAGADATAETTGRWLPIHNAVNRNNYKAFAFILNHLKKIDIQKYFWVKTILDTDRAREKAHLDMKTLAIFLDKYESETNYFA